MRRMRTAGTSELNSEASMVYGISGGYGVEGHVRAACSTHDALRISRVFADIALPLDCLGLDTATATQAGRNGDVDEGEHDQEEEDAVSEGEIKNVNFLIQFFGGLFNQYAERSSNLRMQTLSMQYNSEGSEGDEILLDAETENVSMDSEDHPSTGTQDGMRTFAGFVKACFDLSEISRSAMPANEEGPAIEVFLRRALLPLAAKVGQTLVDAEKRAAAIARVSSSEAVRREMRQNKRVLGSIFRHYIRRNKRNASHRHKSLGFEGAAAFAADFFIVPERCSSRAFRDAFAHASARAGGVQRRLEYADFLSLLLRIAVFGKGQNRLRKLSAAFAAHSLRGFLRYLQNSGALRVLRDRMGSNPGRFQFHAKH
eukprot:g1879.t1